MKLQIILVINKIALLGLAPSHLVKNFGHGPHMILYLYSHLKNVKLTAQVHANSYKGTKVYTDSETIYVTDSEIYCNTRIHDILKIHD